MKIHQDVFDFEYCMEFGTENDSAIPLILSIIGSFTASMGNSGTWTWVLAFLAQYDHSMSIFDLLPEINKLEIKQKVDSIIEERLNSLDDFTLN